MSRGIITISETGTVTMPTVSVWMTQFEIADLFGVFSCDIRKAIHSIYKNKELNELDTMKYIKQPNDISYDVYNLEMVIAIAFRICSRESILFRRFVINEISTIKKATPITLFVGSVQLNGSGKVGRQAVSGRIFLKRVLAYSARKPCPCLPYA